VTLVGMPSEEGRVTERESLVAFIESSRAAYDYTVVDAGTFLRSNTAMALAALVDGILVTVRVGRAPSDDDELLVRTIEHSRGRIVGVVATDGKAIAEFERGHSVERTGASSAAAPSRTHAHPSVFAAGRAVGGKA
jgi:Mrp family chromosome partitioning ATPase